MNQHKLISNLRATIAGMQKVNPAKYGLGFAFIETVRNKKTRYTVIEILTTYNSRVEVVDLTYVLEHSDMNGYTIKQYEVPERRIDLSVEAHATIWNELVV